MVVKIAAQPEGQRGQQTVRDHDQDRAGHSDQAKAGNSKEHEAHMGHAGVAN